jgi:hypothetical protein
MIIKSNYNPYKILDLEFKLILKIKRNYQILAVLLVLLVWEMLEKHI